MTDKEILLRELSARHPYGVILKVGIFDNGFIKYHNEKLDYHSKLLSLIKLDGGYYSKGLFYKYSQFSVRPYLRPISDLTEDECNKLFEILKIHEENPSEWLKINDVGILRLFTEEGKDFYEIAEAFDYLYSIHVDFRGLIERELAIEVKRNFYFKD